MDFVNAKQKPLTKADVGSQCIFLFEGWPHPVIGTVVSELPSKKMRYRVDGAYESIYVVEDGSTGDRLKYYAKFELPK